MKLRLALVAVLLAVVAAVGRSGDAGADTTAFEGTFPEQLGACAAPHAFTIAAGTTTIDAVATATIPSNDIVLNLLDDALSEVASG